MQLDMDIFHALSEFYFRSKAFINNSLTIPSKNRLHNIASYIKNYVDCDMIKVYQFDNEEGICQRETK